MLLPKHAYVFGDGKIIMNGVTWSKDSSGDFSGSYGLVFVALDPEDSPGVGNPITEDVFIKTMTKTPELAFIFKNVESLDVVIDNLTRLREYMTEKKDE